MERRYCVGGQTAPVDALDGLRPKPDSMLQTLTNVGEKTSMDWHWNSAVQVTHETRHTQRQFDSQKLVGAPSQYSKSFFRDP